jgi:hypothetical protein
VQLKEEVVQLTEKVQSKCCKICMNNDVDTVILCGHTACMECLDATLLTGVRRAGGMVDCPTCRKPFDRVDLVRIFW